MPFGRTLPPAAAPIEVCQFVTALRAFFGHRHEVERLQRDLSTQFGVRHCFLVSSGKAALTLALQALKELYPDRDEVVIPAFTCYSVPASVLRARLRLRLCDLDPERLDLDHVHLRRVLELGSAHGGAARGKVLAVIPTHLYGFPADVANLRTIAREAGAYVVEDATQAMGELADTGRVGTLGDIGVFSLARGKVLTSVEGGVILTERDDIAQVLNRLVGGLPPYGIVARLKLVLTAAALMLLMHPQLFWIPRNMPFLKLGETLFEPGFPMLRMSPFQAALMNNWGERLAASRAVRSLRVSEWLQYLAQSDHARCFSCSRPLGLIRLPIRISDKIRRGSLLELSMRLGLGIMPSYPTSIARIPELRDLFNGEQFPVADGYAADLVTLPTHEYLTESDIANSRSHISQVLEQHV